MDLTLLDVGWISVAVMVALLFTGIPVGAAMAVVGFVGFAFISGIEPAMALLETVPYSTVASFSLSVIPLFVLMGQFAFASGISKELYDAGNKWLGRYRGGLAMATVGAAAGFGAMCGSSAAATATFASVALPEMKKARYDMGFAAAAVSVTGTLAIMIPPSGAFILYGVITQTSIGRLFIAGIVPGIILATLYILAIYLVARWRPELAPRGQSYTLGEKLASLKGSWPMIVLFFGVMGGIWLGVFTATEAGAVGAFGAFLFFLSKGKCTWQNLRTCLTDTANITTMLFIILIGANILGYLLAVTGLPQAIAAWFKELPVDRYAIICGIMVMYFFMGCIMDMLSMIVLTTPIFFPVVMGLGFDPLWYGVLIVVTMEQGQVTPPVGIGLYIICGVSKDVKMGQLIRNLWPFITAMLVFMFIMIFFPELSLYLPSMMKR